MSQAEKLLEKMRRSLDGWGQSDLETLYRGFGFEVDHGSKHDIAIHPAHPELRGTIARHNKLAKGYISHAIKTIDSLIEKDGIK